MVNPDSELYRAHPDWVIHFPDAQRAPRCATSSFSTWARTDVQEYLIDLLDRLLSEHNIVFIKWDMNRNVSEPGWPEAPGDPRELWVRYVQGVYHVWSTLAQRHPQVLWQSCSGGGGRVDLGMLQMVDQILGQRQHRSDGAAWHPGGLLAGLSRHHDGVAGYPHGQPAAAADLPLSREHAGRAGHERRPARMDRRGDDDRRRSRSPCTRRFARSCSSATSTACCRHRAEPILHGST